MQRRWTLERYSAQELRDTRWFEGRFHDTRLRDTLILAHQIVPRDVAAKFMAMHEQGEPCFGLRIDTDAGTVVLDFPGQGFFDISLRQRLEWAIRVVTGAVRQKHPFGPDVAGQTMHWIQEWESDTDTLARKGEAQGVIKLVMNLDGDLATAEEQFRSASTPLDKQGRAADITKVRDERDRIKERLSPERQLCLEEARVAARDDG